MSYSLFRKATTEELLHKHMGDLDIAERCRNTAARIVGARSCVPYTDVLTADPVLTQMVLTRDRHKPGYMATYMRARRAKLKAAK